MYVSFFVSGYICVAAVFKQKWQPNDPLQSSTSFSKRMTIYEKLPMGDEVTTSEIGKKQHCQYKYSAKEMVDIDKYSRTDVLWLQYPLCHLGNMRTLK